MFSLDISISLHLLQVYANLFSATRTADYNGRYFSIHFHFCLYYRKLLFLLVPFWGSYLSLVQTLDLKRKIVRDTSLISLWTLYLCSNLVWKFMTTPLFKDDNIKEYSWDLIWVAFIKVRCFSWPYTVVATSAENMNWGKVIFNIKTTWYWL